LGIYLFFLLTSLCLIEPLVLFAPLETGLHVNGMGHYHCHLKSLYQMKPKTVTTASANARLVSFSTARITRHHSAKKAKSFLPPAPPDEETLMRLNAMARQYPFCILHREKNNKLL
jgi:hypothetical protein